MCPIHRITFYIDATKHNLVSAGLCKKEKEIMDDDKVKAAAINLVTFGACLQKMDIVVELVREVQTLMNDSKFANTKLEKEFQDNIDSSLETTRALQGTFAANFYHSYKKLTGTSIEFLEGKIETATKDGGTDPDDGTVH